MAVEIRVPLSDAAQQRIDQLRRLPDVLGTAIVRGLDDANNRALHAIIPPHFTGPGPFPVDQHRLGQRTGLLYSSLRVSNATLISGVDSFQARGALGANVKYFGVHEFGFNGQVYVQEHVRHSIIQHFEGKRISNAAIDKLGLRRKDGTPRKGVTRTAKDVTVHAFTRWMHTPAAAPLRTGIEENLPMYRQTLSAAVLAATAVP